MAPQFPPKMCVILQEILLRGIYENVGRKQKKYQLANIVSKSDQPTIVYLSNDASKTNH